MDSDLILRFTISLRITLFPNSKKRFSTVKVMFPNRNELLGKITKNQVFLPFENVQKM